MTESQAVPSIEELEDQLNDFASEARGSALVELARRVDTGKISVPAPKPEVNLHFHTFFSFNAHGWSPSRIAWEARKYGLMAAGLVDFDVLDGMEEFLAAGEVIGLRTTAALETRVLIPEYADKVISSPNEPGIGYYMAGGCFGEPAAGTESAATLQAMRDMARRRNMLVLDKVNDYLDSVRLDYDEDVLPLTPSGNVTERHMLAAYDVKADMTFGCDPETVSRFWAEKLGMEAQEAWKLLANTPALHEKMRSKLMKYGGVGYVKPDSGSFPSLEDAITMMQGMGALPMATWLDGTNPGEEDSMAFLKLFLSKGCVAMNAIPDRNWNIRNPEEKALKVKRLGEIVAAARELDMPICVGTEMNKLGLPFVDNFDAPELQPFIKDFMDGAYTLYGHTILARYANLGYLSPQSISAFGSDAAARNRFYLEAGKRYPADKARTMIAEEPPVLGGQRL